jgi:hypothetical protein
MARVRAGGLQALDIGHPQGLGPSTVLHQMVDR